MRMRVVRWWAVAAAALAWPASAWAQQIDTNPPVPNVLLLIDNSGSMERMIDSSLPEATPANTCNCDPVLGTCVWSQAPASPNRWGILLQALTGQLTNGYNCAAMPRAPSSVFAQEYSINGIVPYDVNYYLPFHRMIAQDTTVTPSVACDIAPGVLAGAAIGQGIGPTRNATGTTVSANSFVSGDVIARPYGSLNTVTSTCQFSQLTNGAVNTMTNLMRFGLMMFDNDPSSATGVVPSGSNLLVAPAPYVGMWSYYPGWTTNATCPYTGNPADCSTSTTMAVGARNPAAPPWEGRMVAFPATTDIATQEQNNSNIEDVIRSSRPYGGTPMAGMLTGAQYYFWTDPTGPQQTDVFVSGNCRQEYIIILTDGAPNEDMRPDCAAAASTGSPAGVCPFATPQTIAGNLYNGGKPSGANQFVTTYVIGFAVSTYEGTGGTTSACSSLVSGGQLASMCLTAVPTDSYYPCCQLQEIALAGGSGQAYFADSPGDLQNALGSILANIAKQATTRTVPAYSPVITNVLSTASTPNQEIFYASFSPSPGQAWSGDVQRSRFYCGSSSSSALPSGSTSSSASSSPNFNPQAGDDFADNLNSTLGPSRTFIAFEPNLASGGTAWASIRPFIASPPPDGAVTYGVTTYEGNASNVVSQIMPGAIHGIATTGSPLGCPYTPNNALGTQYLTPAQCLNMTLDFTFAQPAGSFNGPSNFTFTSRYGNAFADVYHASPAVVGPPESLLQDPSYEAFQARWSNNVKCGTSTSSISPRPTTVYVATNDGLLHAFWADEVTEENNEQWAMLMPDTMQNLLSTYPSSHQFLLDGSPIVKDVVWDRTASSATSNTASAWHTTLAAGYGPYQRGYYAVDVTDPCPPPAGTTTSGQLPASGPVFRWQLTTMPSGNYPIFGNFSGTPAVTTLFMDPGDGNGARDIGVAILPGGWNGPPASTASCTRQAKTAANYSTPTSGYATRGSVRCWGANLKPTDPVLGRSVAIVRLDTGEILRVFAPTVDYASYTGDTLVARNRITPTPLDSPMTGTPVVYPSDVGADATKFFVGDADGTMWRFDVSSPTPANWVGTVYLDFYNATADLSSTSWQDGQPFEVTPILSVDPLGEVVMNAATGTTETFDNNGTYFVYSVTEQVQGTGTLALGANVNWFLGASSSPSPLRQGERVSGPMTVFNNTLYFSTYYAGSPASLSCTSGDARLWGLNFNTPYEPSGTTTPCTANPASCRENGGLFVLNSTNGYIDVGATFPGRVVPGVAVQATPACGTFSTVQDSYVAGVTHQATTSFTAGQFSLVALVGGVPGAGGLNANPYSVSLPTPVTPTLINSWAAVLE
jgi:type IV pilus assembly protein PilY1